MNATSTWKPGDTSFAANGKRATLNDSAKLDCAPSNDTGVGIFTPALASTLCGVIKRQQAQIDQLAETTEQLGNALWQAQLNLDADPELDPPDETFAGLEDALTKHGQLENARRYLLAVITEDMRQRADNATRFRDALRWAPARTRTSLHIGPTFSQKVMCEIAGVEPPEPLRG